MTFPQAPARRPALAPLAALVLSACAGAVAPAPPAGDPYVFTPPPAAAPPVGLDAATWTTHLRDDLLPFWTMDEAKGVPVGNFPTYRGMDGRLLSPTTRKPRMMARQIFAYAIGFALTGDEALLDLARAGNRWLLDHARDTARGGWHAELDLAGISTGDSDKLSQDMAYDTMGPAAWFWVTGDPEAEAAVLATRDLLFDPARYWDAPNGRIRDGMNAALTAEAYMGIPGSWELVAQLDPVTAFLLLTQPLFTLPARRDQALSDLHTLASRMQASFWRDGLFWGATGSVGSYGSNHSDFGHILKAYGAVLQIDKRLPDHPFQKFLSANAPSTLTLAHDAPNGRWAKLPASPTVVRYGSDWWAYAEADQLAASLAFHDPAWIAVLAQTARHFREDYVDRTRPAREVVSSISQTGAWVYPWPDTDNAKCNQWKSGFHTSEHALVMYLFSSWLGGTTAPLYFAFPSGSVDAMAAAARPYTLEGRVARFEDLGPLTGDPSRHKVRVHFADLR